MLSNAARSLFDRCLHFAQRAWPAHCPLCGAARSEGGAFCGGCAAALPALPAQRCRVCAIGLAAGELCGACLDRPPYYDGVSAAYAYAFPVDALIHAYKYGGELSLAPVLGAALAQAASAETDALVPMPLSDTRLRERGFNQALELARHAGRALGVAVRARACRKTRDTPPQAALPWAARTRNVRGAFVCDEDFEGLRVAVVDDVMTTGATVNELARNLKRAGAASVWVWVVARTLREHPARGW